jgi:RNA polymerase sigma-70 factor (ECF subfamily)
MEAHATIMNEPDPIADAIRQGAYRDAVALSARHHGIALGRFCMALLGDAAEAEETTQETLIAAFDAFPQYRGEGSVRGFLFGIARRLCAKRLTTLVRRERRLQLVHDATPESQTPADLLDRRRRAMRVRDALEALKPSEREAVVLRYESGLPYREIAELMAIDEPAARKRVSRALLQLRTTLTDEVMR